MGHMRMVRWALAGLGMAGVTAAWFLRDALGVLRWLF